MAGFNDWISFDPAPVAQVEHFDDVERSAKEDLAKQIQTRLRNTLDRGTSRQGARRAQSVQATVDGEDIVVNEKDQAEVLGENPAELDRGEGGEENTSVDSLFSPGTGVPTIVKARDGSQQAAFRVIKEQDLFGGSQTALDQTVEQTVTDIVQMGMLEAFEDATRTVESQHPELKR
jgi:hypothetical protein